MIYLIIDILLFYYFIIKIIKYITYIINNMILKFNNLTDLIKSK